MIEKEKMLTGELYNASDKNLTNDRLNALKADFPTIFENYMSHQKDFKGDIIRALK